MENTNILAEKLVSMPLFKGVTKEEIKTMLPCLCVNEKHYSKNEFIYIENDSVANVGLVLSGTIHMIKEDFQGNRSHLVSMKEGELFGETFALCEQPSYVTFQAATGTDILLFPLDKVIYFCSNSCPFHKRMVHNTFVLLSQKNMQLMKRIEAASQNSLREKIICYFSQLKEEQQCNHITLPLSKTELAAYLNCNRSALMRELSNMQNDGIININKNIVILN